MSNTRYFFVAYRADNVVGSMTFGLEGGKFINRKSLESDLNIGHLIITNILELSKEDYTEYRRLPEQ